MTVSELIAHLQQFPSDALIVLSDEADEHLCTPLKEIGLACYTPRTPWYGEIDTDDGRYGRPAVVLWPTS